MSKEVKQCLERPTAFGKTGRHEGLYDIWRNGIGRNGLIIPDAAEPGHIQNASITSSQEVMDLEHTSSM